VIETRTLALVVGSLSLAFGIWAATGAPSEVGLAAGALGFVAGLIALVPRGTRPAVDKSRTATVPQAPESTRAAGDTGATGGAALTDETTPSTAGHFDRDSTPGQRNGRPAAVEATAATGGPPSTDAVPAGPSGTQTAPEAADGAPAATPLTDPVTGLFSEDYLVVALEGRLASARRHLRPVALALLQITQGLPDTGSRPADPGLVAKAISNTVRDSDIACRLADGTFGVILEDTPENGAVWTVERIRRNLVSTSGHHTLWAGVACYPAHAFDAGELMTQVHDALGVAREWNQDRIEVAIAE
jgi:diguanylate cyclase (GGDEF)-like protein